MENELVFEPYRPQAYDSCTAETCWRSVREPVPPVKPTYTYLGSVTGRVRTEKPSTSTVIRPCDTVTVT